MTMKIARLLAILATVGSFIALIADFPPLFFPWAVWFVASCAAAIWLWPGGRTVVFVLLALGGFVLVSSLITNISGGTEAAVAAAGVNPEAGEAIYWGKGKCGTCHSLGDQGSAVRGPNHENVCAVSQERVAERQAAGAANIQDPTDYLVESIADPDAYIVEGYSAAMPKAYLPPISLTSEEIMAVITYMQAQGCEPDPSAIELPPEVLAAETEEVTSAAPFSLVVAGDPGAGKTLFFDPTGAAGCGTCHAVAGEGADVGPDLTDVAALQTTEYIFESIMNPSAKIASGGYEPVLLQLKDGSVVSGIIAEENETAMTIKDKEGNVIPVNRADIQRERRYPDEPSIMPGNYGELLTVQQVADLIAFLQESSGVGVSTEAPAPAEAAPAGAAPTPAASPTE